MELKRVGGEVGRETLKVACLDMEPFLFNCLLRGSGLLIVLIAFEKVWATAGQGEQRRHSAQVLRPKHPDIVLHLFGLSFEDELPY
eukprot:6266636-Amphidinium_carterae.1